MAQSKAHMDAASRFNKKTYDRIQVSIRKDAEINRDTQSCPVKGRKHKWVFTESGYRNNQAR